MSLKIRISGCGNLVTTARFNLFSLLALGRELKKEVFQIVHCHGLYPSIWGRLAAVFAGVPIKISIVRILYYGINLEGSDKTAVLEFRGPVGLLRFRKR